MIQIHAYIDVSSIERGIDFYCNGLGLSVKRKLSPTWVELDGADIPIFLLAPKSMEVDLGTRRAQRTWDRHWTPVHLDFVVANVADAVDRAVNQGGSLKGEIKEREYGRIVNMADPFGNGFDLIEFSGDGYEGVDRN